MILLAALALAQTFPPALPAPRQIAWQRMETNIFVHFGPNTFTDLEWGGGKEDPNLFNPSEMDCDQWARTFKSAGFKGVIVTAKHHDGFCLWPSKLSTHTVAQSRWKNGKGDVLKELSDACRRNGLKFGVYLSPWDRNHPSYGTPAYNKVFAAMLKEVLTHYGPVFEVWFDGANGEGPNGKKQVYDWPLFYATVRKYQPKAVMFSDTGPDVRWVGNEDGIAPETCWSPFDSHFHREADRVSGEESGDQWSAPECDVSIRPGWFYHKEQDVRVKTPAQLFDLYEKSVGRNGLLLLNVPPDRRGLITDYDARSLAGFHALVQAAYGTKLPTRGKWEGSSITLRVSGSSPFNRVVLGEDIAKGQNVRKFHVEARTGSGEWQPIAQGTTIGFKRIVPVSETTATEVRITIDSSRATPTLLVPTLHLSKG